MTTQRAQPEIWFRFRCAACGFTRQTRDRQRDPQYCPGCCYPRDLAGHVYRPEPEDGAELDA